MDFLDVIEKRKTHYHLGKNGKLKGEEIEALVKKVLYLTPAAFNQANQEVLLLLDDAHIRYWNIVEEALRKAIGDGDFSVTAAKVEGYRKAQGTLLIYEDLDVVKKLQESFPLYKNNFPEWSVTQSGMLQILLWNALTDQGMGANLSHYNPLVDDEVEKTWNVPSNWRLTAQITFGESLGGEEFSTHPDVDGRFFVHTS